MMILNLATYPHRAPVLYAFTPKSFLLSLCMPVEPREETPRERYETLLMFGAIDPIPEYESEAA